MASSSTDIANLALKRVGVAISISTISDTNDAGAVACAAFYDMVRVETLEAWWWRFATKRAVLAELSSIERDGWGYVYDLPSDCVQPQYIWSGVREEQSQVGQRIPFDIERESTGADSQDRVLLTDVAPTTDEAPLLIYTFDVTDVTKWPQHFVNAVAWRLAAEIAVPLSAKADKARLAFDMAGASLNNAIASQQRAREPGAPQDSELIAVRG